MRFSIHSPEGDISWHKARTGVRVLTRSPISRIRRASSSARRRTRPSASPTAWPIRAARPVNACRKWRATSKARSTSPQGPANGDACNRGYRRLRYRGAVEVLTAPEKPVFAGLINQATSAVSRVVLQYAARASVAVPFVIALGFALAAIAAHAGRTFWSGRRLLDDGGWPRRHRRHSVDRGFGKRT